MLIVFELIKAFVDIGDTLAGRHTRFLLSHKTKYGIDFDNSSQTFFITKYIKTDSSIFRINRNGEYLTLKNKSKYVCDKKGIMTTCKKPSLFKFKSVPSGFQILSNGKCLTSGKIIKFKECKKNKKSQKFTYDRELAFSCIEPVFYEDGKKEPILAANKPLSEAQKKEIFKKELEKLKIKNPEVKKALAKAWFSNSWNLPKFSFC